MNMKDQLNFFPIKRFLLCNRSARSYFIFHRNITSSLLKKSIIGPIILINVGQTFIQKFHVEVGQTKEWFFISLSTTAIIVMYAAFKINPFISEFTCASYNVHPTYLLYTSQPSNNSHSSKHQSWQSNFSILNE